MAALAWIVVAVGTIALAWLAWSWWQSLPPEEQERRRARWEQQANEAREARDRRTAEKNGRASGSGGRRRPISEVGNRERGVLTCPRCGGAQFTAKRSNKGKVIGFTTLGVGGLIAPKSQVKCVTCGAMYKRG